MYHEEADLPFEKPVVHIINWSPEIRTYLQKKAQYIRMRMMEQGLYPTEYIPNRVPKELISRRIELLDKEDLTAVIELVDLLIDNPADQGEKGSLFLYAMGQDHAALLEARAREKARKAK